MSKSGILEAPVRHKTQEDLIHANPPKMAVAQQEGGKKYSLFAVPVFYTNTAEENKTKLLDFLDCKPAYPFHAVILESIYDLEEKLIPKLEVLCERVRHIKISKDNWIEFLTESFNLTSEYAEYQGFLKYDSSKQFYDIETKAREVFPNAGGEAPYFSLIYNKAGLIRELSPEQAALGVDCVINNLCLVDTTNQSPEYWRLLTKVKLP